MSIRGHHRADVGGDLIEADLGNLGDAERIGDSAGKDPAGRRFVVGHIEDIEREGLDRAGGDNGGDQIVDMDSAHQGVGWANQPERARPHSGKDAAPRTIDAGGAQRRDLDSVGVCRLDKRRLGAIAGCSPWRPRSRRERFIDHTTARRRVDSGRGHIHGASASALSKRLDQAPLRIAGRITRRARVDRDERPVDHGQLDSRSRDIEDRGCSAGPLGSLGGGCPRAAGGHHHRPRGAALAHQGLTDESCTYDQPTCGYHGDIVNQSVWPRLVRSALSFTTLWFAMPLAAPIIATAGCGGHPVVAQVSDLPAKHPLDGYARSFVLLAATAGREPSLTTDRIGESHESITAEGLDETLSYRRNETLSVLREDTLIEVQTQVTIDFDAGLVARRVVVRRSAGEQDEVYVAARERDGSWRIDLGDGTVREADGEVGIAELEVFRQATPMAAPAPRRLLLPGYRFAEVGARRDTLGSAQRLYLETPWGEAWTEVVGDERGLPTAITTSTGIAAVAVREGAITDAYKAVDLIERAAIDVTGTPLPTALPDIELSLVRPRAIPAIPGLPSAPTRRGTIASPPREAMAIPATLATKLAEYVQATHNHLAADLGRAAATASEALRLGRGDCNAYTLVFIELAAADGLDARVVTGYRFDGRRLLRHRWAAVLDNGSWHHIDPSFAEIPARGLLLGLVMTRVADGELALIDDVVYAPMAGATAAVRPTPSTSQESPLHRPL